MINFNLFVLPFSLGLLYLLLAIAKRWYQWIKALPAHDKVKLRAGIRHPEVILTAIKEVVLEGLIHRKMWLRNPILGYMHMSFALGWFLLIVMGNFESRFYSGTHLNAPYYPIFLKFFIHDKLVIFFEVYTVPGFFRFVMDFLLLFVLSGLLLAVLKRQKSKWFGMTRTTEFQLSDRVSLTCLWLIFPMRLLAESFTAGYYGSGGGFMTQPLGEFLVSITPFPSDFVAYTMWWSYSLVLGIFFVTMPYSRYMHIPTEILLIFFRNFGIQPRKWNSSFSDVEVHACSRCGVCIDVCQMNEAGIRDSQAVYFIRGVRDQFVPDEITRKCLVCGRCQEVCPVGIQTDSLRLIKRRELFSGQAADYSYLSPPPRQGGGTPSGWGDPVRVVAPRQGGVGAVAYFSGCMTQLTPTISRAMKGIMEKAGISYVHLDADRSICCGRPLMISGKDKQANDLMTVNKELIKQSQATLLVTSCPICYRVFREEYGLPIHVQHHTQFILDLVKSGKIPLQSHFRKVAYHDPCDLGRGSRVYNAPREVLAKLADLVPDRSGGANAPCCGGSLGILNASQQQRDVMSKAAVQVLTQDQPEILATACPLCKKTLMKHTETEVKDIAELVYSAIPG